MFEALRTYRDQVADRRIETLCDDAERVAAFTIETDGLTLDASKTNLDADGLSLLHALMQDRGVEPAREAMFSGEKINTTEDRAVLHTALRAPANAVVNVDGENVIQQVHETMARMKQFAADVRGGRFQGQGGLITDVINIGIGGSDLGPAMAALALAPYHDGPRVHFVSNVDPADIHDTLSRCNPGTTLVIVASKTFTTIETMTNAQTARDWMAKVVKEPGEQFAALSSADDKAAAWGIAPARVFGFEDWVGGRYSMWGPIGLSLMMAIGPTAFEQFLQGGRAMDAHFRSAPLAQNLPVMLAATGLWHNQVCGYPTRAVLPYDNRMARFPAYLQQLEMESNGKRVTRDGQALEDASGPIVWGEPGTNGQHAFYQLIHQGTQIVPCEFLVAARGHEPHLHHQHQLLVANCLAQSEALMKGRSLDEARAKVAGKYEGQELEAQAAQRVFPGNRPSVTFIYEKLTPFVLGQLIAAYEHRVFVEGIVLGINSYDQWGVELGKELATALQPIVEGTEPASGKDASTAGLVGKLREMGL